MITRSPARHLSLAASNDPHAALSLYAARDAVREHEPPLGSTKRLAVPASPGSGIGVGDGVGLGVGEGDGDGLGVGDGLGAGQACVLVVPLACARLETLPAA